MEEPRPKFERTVAAAFLLILVGGCLLVMRPFISALLWAVILSFSLWPLHGRVVRMVGGRRTLASLVLAFGLAAIILVPALVVGLSLADNVQELTIVVKRWMAEPPSAPSWLGKVPLVGTKAVEQWNELAADSSSLMEKAKTLVEPVSLWLLRSGVALGRGLLELALSFLISFFLLRDGLRVGEHLTRGVGRIAGARGQQLLIVAGKTVRGVVYGILGTAFFQAVIAAIGYLIAGVPSVPLLALLTFVLCIVPAVGAPLVWIPAVLWLFHEGATGRGIFLIIWGVAVSSVDNFVKPWLISHGSDMPFLLVFFGALGGLAAFGFIGLFIGPTLLAVTYKLAQEWMATKPSDGSQQDYGNESKHKETAKPAPSA